jgi:hypothetical protein
MGGDEGLVGEMFVVKLPPEEAPGRAGVKEGAPKKISVSGDAIATRGGRRGPSQKEGRS